MPLLKDVFFCIADAKRNHSGDGITYLKSAVVAMTAYMVAFSEPLRACLSAAAGGFTAPLMPTATLFLQQAAFHSDASSELRGAVKSEPAWLATLDARHYAMTENGSWQDVHVCAWFQRVSDSATRSMRPSRGARRSAREAASPG